MKTRIDRFKVSRKMEAVGVSRFDELAKKAGIGEATIYNVLDSYNWTSRTLDRIAHALNCASLDILTVDTDPHMRAV